MRGHAGFGATARQMEQCPRSAGSRAACPPAWRWTRPGPRTEPGGAWGSSAPWGASAASVTCWNGCPRASGASMSSSRKPRSWRRRRLSRSPARERHRLVDALRLHRAGSLRATRGWRLHLPPGAPARALRGAAGPDSAAGPALGRCSRGSRRGSSAALERVWTAGPELVYAGTMNLSCLPAPPPACSRPPWPPRFPLRIGLDTQATEWIVSLEGGGEVRSRSGKPVLKLKDGEKLRIWWDSRGEADPTDEYRVQVGPPRPAEGRGDAHGQAAAPRRAA